MRLVAILKTLATHRITYRFLFVLLGSIGLTSGVQHIGQLEVLLCSVLACTD